MIIVSARAVLRLKRQLSEELSPNIDFYVLFGVMSNFPEPLVTNWRQVFRVDLDL